MTQKELNRLIGTYKRKFGQPIKFKTGYRALSPAQHRELATATEQPRSLYHNLHKTNPHVCKRWGDM